MSNVSLSPLSPTTHIKPARTLHEADERTSLFVQFVQFLLALIWWPIGVLISLGGMLAVAVAAPLFLILFILANSTLAEAAVVIFRYFGL